MENAENKDWLRAEREHEINRLERILREPKATKEEREIAKLQLAEHKGGGHGHGN
jgi:hypothetical protein